MSLHRFFLTGPLPTTAVEPLPLSDADSRHAASVLRITPGEEIEVVEPGGQAWRVRVTLAGARAMHAERIEALATHERPDVTLFQGVAKGEKMDGVVRQAVEVGAEAIVPVFTSRTVVRLVGRKALERTERWRRVAASAAKQAHRERVPGVADPVDLRRALELLRAFDCAIVLWEEHEGCGISQALASCALDPGARIALVVGPEGGLSAEEVSALREAGAVTASLGPDILRTETAAVVALALAIHELGGLGGAAS